jgi:hypothetical protein
MKVLDVRLHENTSSGSRANARGVIDMVKITGSFRNGANVPKKEQGVLFCHCLLRKL